MCLLVERSYLWLAGIHFTNGSDNLFTLTLSDHIKIQRCAFSEAGQDSEGVSGDPLLMRYVSYALVEDCYMWGNGRYRYFILDSDHIILRRCLDRYDRGTSVGWSNQGSFRFYGTSYSLLQNCISIDAGPAEHTLTFANGQLARAQPKVFWSSPNGSYSANHNEVHGLITLNTGQALFGFVGNSAVDHTVIHNSVFWHSGRALWTRSTDAADLLSLHHCTMGQVNDPDNHHDRLAEADVLGLLRLENSIAYGSGDTALRNVISNYNVLYNNHTNYSGGTRSHDYSSDDNNEINPLTNGLRYLPRIEDNSPLAGSGSNGSNRGATILFQVGRSGSLYGEEGYNQLSNEPLWPWPHEAEIKAHLQAYSYNDGQRPTISGDRGFASSTAQQLDGQHDVTLTSYIWEYLGNTMPCAIYQRCQE